MEADGEEDGHDRQAKRNQPGVQGEIRAADAGEVQSLARARPKAR